MKAKTLIAAIIYGHLIGTENDSPLHAEHLAVQLMNLCMDDPDADVFSISRTLDRTEYE